MKDVLEVDWYNLTIVLKSRLWGKEIYRTEVDFKIKWTKVLVAGPVTVGNLGMLAGDAIDRGRESNKKKELGGNIVFTFDILVLKTLQSGC